MSQLTEIRPWHDLYADLVRRLPEQDDSPIAKARAFLAFEIVLPFQLPWPDNIPITIEKDETTALTYCFSQLPIEVPIVANEKIPKVETARTSVLMIRTWKSETEPVEEEELSDGFDQCLEGLNAILVGYAVIASDTDARLVGLRSLPPLLLWRLFQARTDKEISTGILMLDLRGMPYRKELLSPEDCWRITNAANAYIHDSNPFLLPTEINRSALGNLRTGAYRLAVIEAQCAVEVFLNRLLELLLQSEGKSRADIEAYFQPPRSFISRVKSEYHARIGGNFNIEGNGTVGRWYRQLYEIRNAVVHAGTYVDHATGHGSLAAGNSLITYVVSLLKTKPRKFAHILQFLQENDRS